MKLEDVLSELSVDVKKLTEVSIRQEEQLRYHIKRTDLLQESLELLRKEFVPVKKHVDLMNSLAKIMVAVMGMGAALAGIIGALVKFL